MTARVRRIGAALVAIVLLGAGCGAGGDDGAADAGDGVTTVYMVIDLSESVLRGENADTIKECVGAAFDAALRSGVELVLRPVGTTSAVGAITMPTVPPAEVADNISELGEWAEDQVAGLGDLLGRPLSRAGGATTDLTPGLIEARNHFRAQGHERNVLLLVTDFMQTEGVTDLNLVVDTEAETLDLDAWEDDLVTGLQGGDTSAEDAFAGVDVFGLTLQDGSSEMGAFDRDGVHTAWLSALGRLGADTTTFASSTSVCSEQGGSDDQS